jgi:cytochrome-b5 reductase
MRVLLQLLAAAAIAAQDCPAAPEGSSYASEGCYFPTTFLEVPVRAVRQETHDTKVITFGLPDGVSLNLPVSSAILMKAPGVKAGKDAVRPYNPISSHLQKGSFDLLIKSYDDGAASKFASSLKAGDLVAFKQAKFNIKPFRYPFSGVERITMLAGGTGLAPMLQALYPLLETPGETRSVRLLFGNKSPDDILMKAELDRLAQAYPDRFEVIHVVGREEFDESARDSYGWEGEVGWIDEEKIKRLAFPPSAGTVVWVCGLDDMYKSLAGSRMDPLASGSALHNLGYTEEMVWRS